MRKGAISLIFAVFAVGCIASTADARPARGGDGPSFDQVLPQIRQHQPGTFYDADGPFPDADGRQHYRVKWMTPEGRVIWFDADARTGKVTHRDDYARGNDRFNNRDDFDNSDRDDRRSSRRNRFNNDDDFSNPFGSDGERRGNRRRGGSDDADRGNGWGNERGHGGGRHGGGSQGGDRPGRGHNPR